MKRKSSFCPVRRRTRGMRASQERSTVTDWPWRKGSASLTRKTLLSCALPSSGAIHSSLPSESPWLTRSAVSCCQPHSSEIFVPRRSPFDSTRCVERLLAKAFQ